ncbi:hypothetical protein ACHAPU_002754 [Fusarium lateritium]
MSSFPYFLLLTNFLFLSLRLDYTFLLTLANTLRVEVRNMGARAKFLRVLRVTQLLGQWSKRRKILVEVEALIAKQDATQQRLHRYQLTAEKEMTLTIEAAQIELRLDLLEQAYVENGGSRKQLLLLMEQKLCQC